MQIKYENFILYIPRKNHLLDGKEFTWICKYQRKITDSEDTSSKFCNAKIKGIRDAINIKEYEFYLVNNHSEKCVNFNKLNNFQNKEKKKGGDIKYTKENITEKNNEDISGTKENTNTSNYNSIISSKDELNLSSNDAIIKTNDFENRIYKTTNQKEFDLLLKQYFKKNKIYLNKQSAFIKEATRLYNNNINFKLIKYHISN